MYRITCISEQEQGQQHIQLYRQEGGMGHLASQLLIVTQTVCILWWGRPLAHTHTQRDTHAHTHTHMI